MAAFVRDFLTLHVEGEGLAQETFTTYQRALQQWLDWCATNQVDDPRSVSPAQLGEFSKHLRTRPAQLPPGVKPKPGAAPKTLSVHTVGKYLRTLRGLYSWGAANGYLEFNPFDRWKVRTPKAPIQRAFTPTDVRAMLEVTFQQSEQALRDRAILLVLWDTGMRREELVRLDVRDVLDGERLATSVRVRGKFDKERLLELHPQTQRALYHFLTDERKPMTVDEPLFLSRDGERMTPTAVTLLVRREAKRAGLTGARLSPHTFRSGFARAYLDQEGARVDDLQILMGHTSIQMTLMYAGQAAATARRSARTYSPVGLLNLSLGKRLQRGRPRKER